MQFTLQTAETNILQTISAISSIKMLMPNLLYIDFDFKKFPGLKIEAGSRRIFVPVEKPSGLAYAEMELTKRGFV